MLSVCVYFETRDPTQFNPLQGRSRLQEYKINLFVKQCGNKINGFPSTTSHSRVCVRKRGRERQKKHRSVA